MAASLSRPLSRDERHHLSSRLTIGTENVGVGFPRSDSTGLRPRVSGQALYEGRLGDTPIGRTGLLIDAVVDYRLPWFPGFSVDTRIIHEGRRVANAASTLHLPARTTVDLGARYRTRVGRVPVLFRAQLKNAGKVYGWRVSSGGGFTLL